MKKVIAIYGGVTHYLARCQDCGWTSSNYKDDLQGVREICQHVTETGHTVALGKGTLTRYSLEAEQS